MVFPTSAEAPPRPTCSSCGSTKVSTLAKEITQNTLWRCAVCGDTFKVISPGARR